MVIISSQPIIFNIRYTPYQLKQGSSQEQISSHLEERAFYDMTGNKNILSYITQKEKVIPNYSILNYFEKTTKVFNQNGMISEAELEAMKKRVKENKGNIWHGFISFDEEHSHLIDSPEKCIDFVKNIFPKFFKNAYFTPKDMDLMCSLHIDRPHHLHIHFEFWEKEPKYRASDGTLKFRSKGKLNKDVIDKFFIQTGIYISEDKEILYKSRDTALASLRTLTGVKNAFHSSDEIKKEIIILAKSLKSTGRISYGSKEAESYRPQVDKIVEMLLDYDKEARQADLRFYQALEKREKLIKDILSKKYKFSNEDVSLEKMTKQVYQYNYKIDDKVLKMIEDIEADYKKRQGNLVINLAKFIKPELFERDPNKKYKVNQKSLKLSNIISNNRVKKAFKKFLTNFGRETKLFERDFTHRLQEIEEEIKKELEKQQKEGSFKS